MFTVINTIHSANGMQIKVHIKYATNINITERDLNNIAYNRKNILILPNISPVNNSCRFVSRGNQPVRANIFIAIIPIIVNSLLKFLYLS